MFDIALVGSGGMMPLAHRHLSSAMLRYEGRMVLIDCGEGTQVSAKQLGWGFKTIDCICLTHFHADHIMGLPGLLLTIGHAGREESLTIIGPVGVARIVQSICIVASDLPFKVNFVEVPPGGFKGFKIPFTSYILSAHPAFHRCPCFAYRIDIERKGKFDAAAAKELGLPVRFWNKLQKGEVVEHESQTFTPDMVMGEQRRGLSMAYCTDSRPPKGLPEFVSGVDLLICEGQYGDPAKLPNAKAYKHMMFSEAATIARAGNVGKMWLTHFSPSLQNPKEYLKNARDIFPKSYVGFDRKTESFVFEED
ncbi:MAG: ribonuclease Z [Defluviitaleaceae bacterium]|nr:ribonuclease Z [Defluviitaleaceae bacterium]